MNYRKWAKAPVEMTTLKLCEEVGEVAREITDAHMNGQPIKENILDELDHVEFLTVTLRRKILKEFTDV